MQCLVVKHHVFTLTYQITTTFSQRCSCWNTENYLILQFLTLFNACVIGTLLNIHGVVFLRKHLTALRFTLTAFVKKLHHRCVRRSLMYLQRAGTQLRGDGGGAGHLFRKLKKCLNFEKKYTDSAHLHFSFLYATSHKPALKLLIISAQQFDEISKF